MAELIFWQLMPKSKLYPRDWRIQIYGDPKLAAAFRKRSTAEECPIYNAKQWLFCLTFCNKKTALKSVNRIIAKHSYGPLQFNAIESKFVAQRGNHTGLKKNLNPTNGGSDA